MARVLKGSEPNESNSEIIQEVLSPGEIINHHSDEPEDNTEVPAQNKPGRKVGQVIKEPKQKRIAKGLESAKQFHVLPPEDKKQYLADIPDDVVGEFLGCYAIIALDKEGVISGLEALRFISTL